MHQPTTKSSATEAHKPPEERAPFFLVKYGYQQQEMRRNSDASVVTEFSVESVTATRTPFVLVQYFGGEAELRRADDDRRAVSLSAPKPEVKPVDRARFFVVTYPSAPLEVRSSSSGQVLATLPGGDGLEGKSADDRVFAVRYRANGKRIALFDGGGQWISLPSVPTAVVFDPSHSRYVVIYDDRNAELRRSNGAGIDELPAPVKEAVFAGDHLILLYRNSNVEIRDGLGAVTATDSGVSTIDEIPATGSVLLRRGKSPAKLVHLKTNTWREMPPIGWIDRKLAPTNAGSLHFFVAQKMIGSEARFDVWDATMGDRAMTAETAASSENTPWISLSTETEARLFNLRDGRQVVLDGVDLKRVPVTILEPREQVMRQRPIAIYSWPGIPVMVIGSKPAQIRRVRDGALLAKLPAGLSTIPVLSPDGKRIALACQHILREYPRTSPNQGQTVLARDEPVIHDAFSGRKLATFAGGARDVQYTAHHTFTYKGGEGKTESAEVHDLRRGKPIGRLRGVQVDDGHEWFAVQHETARSELWRDGRKPRCVGRWRNFQTVRSSSGPTGPETASSPGKPMVRSCFWQGTSSCPCSNTAACLARMPFGSPAAHWPRRRHAGPTSIDSRSRSPDEHVLTRIERCPTPFEIKRRPQP